MKSLSEILKLARNEHDKQNENKTKEIISFSEAYELPFDKAKKSLFLVLSLSCAHCIELIPELSIFNNVDGFYLITDGDEEDNHEIKKEFEYEFTLYSFKKPLDRVNVFKTPTSLLVNEEGNIIENSFTPSVFDISNFHSKREKI